MRSAHSVAQVRTAEDALRHAMPEGTLMRRAAHGLAAVCCDLLPSVYGARVLVLAGTGDNGGDALFAGALLSRRGAQVTVRPTGARLHEAGLAALRAAGGRLDPDADPREAHLVLDGILGIGGRGALRPDAAALAAHVDASGAFVVAVDLPSGVDSDSGEVPGAAVRSDVTVTFGTLKPGLLVDPGAALAGAVRVVDIGLGPYLPAPVMTVLQAPDVAAMTGPPARDADKYRRGVLGVVAGSDTYPGAAVLAVGGAIAAGAGMVRYVGPSGAAQLVQAAWPESVVTVIEEGYAPDLVAVGRVQAWVVGPGLGTGEHGRSLVAGVLRSAVPAVVDADGLRGLDDVDLRQRAASTVLTPHAGELARLLGTSRDEVEASSLRSLRAAVAATGATVLLKGATTLVAVPERAESHGPVRANPTGTPFLATAGSGDTLAGALGALLARGLPPGDAASAAAWLHGLSGRLASRGAPIRAGDVAGGWADAVRVAAGTIGA